MFIRQFKEGKENSRDIFSFIGKINGKPCSFKIDTGSDVSVLSARLSVPLRWERIESSELRYPTGEKVFSLEFLLRFLWRSLILKCLYVAVMIVF